MASVIQKEPRPANACLGVQGWIQGRPLWYATACCSLILPALLPAGDPTGAQGRVQHGQQLCGWFPGLRVFSDHSGDGRRRPQRPGEAAGV